MGIAFEDLNSDGLPDLFVTTLWQEKFAVYFNAGDETFTYTTAMSDVGSISYRHGGWGLGVFDYDNDSGSDIFIATSHVMDNIERSQPHIRYQQRPLLPRNEKGRFTDVSAEGGSIFERVWAGRGAALGDLDNDGYLDVVVVNLDGPAYYARNRSAERTGNHWIGIHLTTDVGDKLYRVVNRAGSYQSSHDPRAFFGLGKSAKVRSISIRWPSGAQQTIEPTEVDRVIRVQEPRGE